MRKLKFLLKKDGTAMEVSPTGYGAQCLDVTKDLETRVGKVNENDRVMNSDFFHLRNDVEVRIETLPN